MVIVCCQQLSPLLREHHPLGLRLQLPELGILLHLLSALLDELHDPVLGEGAQDAVEVLPRDLSGSIPIIRHMVEEALDEDGLDPDVGYRELIPLWNFQVDDLVGHEDSLPPSEDRLEEG